MTTVKNIYDYINSIAPFDMQEEWDNSGFLIGDFRKEVKTVVLSLDATKDVCEFVSSINADLLITHHPVIFNGIKGIEKGSAVYTLVNNDIAQISAHTSFDTADCGINFNLATMLGLKNIRKIDDTFIFAGELDNGMSIDDFAEYVAEILDSNALRYTSTDKLINTVAVGGGACEEYVDKAMSEADAFVTGEMKYHTMLDAKEKDYAVISAGHYETENKPFLMLSNMLKKVFCDVEFVSAPCENPIDSI